VRYKILAQEVIQQAEIRERCAWFGGEWGRGGRNGHGYGGQTTGEGRMDAMGMDACHG